MKDNLVQFPIQVAKSDLALGDKVRATAIPSDIKDEEDLAKFFGQIIGKEGYVAHLIDGSDRVVIDFGGTRGTPGHVAMSPDEFKLVAKGDGKVFDWGRKWKMEEIAVLASIPQDVLAENPMAEMLKGIPVKVIKSGLPDHDYQVVLPLGLGHVCVNEDNLVTPDDFKAQKAVAVAPNLH
ncbi:hypothetical protein [Anaeroselena agilis]|uniref:Uncharacterized protein n=1 Tax=Anaeroselena agilis TaxID=3063788 RepID=A0ABU3NVQ4_9FIRM|nr:hypothetical protein [Selenomonadales bacterium 4137-cl]